MQTTYRIEYWNSETGQWWPAGEVSESTAGKAIKYALRYYTVLSGLKAKDVRAIRI